MVTTKSHSQQYIWQLHFARRLAVIGIQSYDLYKGWWLLFGQLIRFTFITLVGVSIAMASHKSLKNTYIHGLKILICAALITLITYMVVPKTPIRFGILHLIAFGIFLAAPLRKQKLFSLALALLIYLASLYMPVIQTAKGPLAIILGIDGHLIPDLDYFPLFPWLSLIFLGIYFGNIIKTHSQKKAGKLSKTTQLINTCGKKSLLIYMIHVPILIILIYLVVKFPSL